MGAQSLIHGTTKEVPGNFFQGDDGEYSEEENSKVELKSEANDAANSSAKDEKGEEKPDTKRTVTGERQSGDGQVSTHQRPPFPFEFWNRGF